MPARRRSNSSGGDEEQVKDWKEEKRRLEEEKKMLDRRMEEKTKQNTKLVYRIGGGEVMRVAWENGKRWEEAKKNSEDRRDFLKEELKRVEKQEERLAAYKAGLKADLTAEEVTLGVIGGHLAKLASVRPAQEVENSWDLEMDAVCGCLGACGCVREVVVKVGKGGEEVKEIKLVGEELKKESKVEKAKVEKAKVEKAKVEKAKVEKSEVEKSEVEKSEVEKARKELEKRSKLNEAMLEAKELANKIKRALDAKEWRLLESFKREFDTAWAVIKSAEQERGVLEERWYILHVDASIWLGQAMANVGKWGVVETVVGGPDSKDVKIPRTTDPGYNAQRVADWLILRARARLASRWFSGATYDLDEATKLAEGGGRRNLGWQNGEGGKNWARRTMEEVEKWREQVEKMKREERRRR